jgi:CelD/BcsL family acetyltransferase involved in cellulose biosynthesis
LREAQSITCQEIARVKPEDSLWREWTDLLSKAAPEQRMFGPEWYTIWSRAWARAAGRWTEDFTYITARDANGELRGILPMGAYRYGPALVRAQTGYSQPCRALLAATGWEEIVGGAFGDYIGSRSWDFIQIGPVVESRVAPGAMINALRKKSSLYVFRSDDHAVLDLPQDWEQYRRQVLGGRFYRKIRYYERRTARAGDMEVVHTRAPSTDEAALLFERLASIESRSWLANDGDPRFIGPHAQKLWRDLTRKVLTPNDNLDCWTMLIHGRPVSFCLTLTTGSCRFVIANNYDESCGEHRTGSTLYRYMLEDACRRGIRQVDFGPGQLHYKKYWGAKARGRMRTFLAFRKNIFGKGARLALALVHCAFGTRDFRTLSERLL